MGPMNRKSMKNTVSTIFHWIVGLLWKIYIWMLQKHHLSAQQSGKEKTSMAALIGKEKTNMATLEKTSMAALSGKEKTNMGATLRMSNF